MLRSAFFFLVWTGRCAASFFSDDPQKIAIASLEGEPSALVADCVYALSGDYCETAVDLCIPGIEPLAFQRTFTSFWGAGDFFGEWSCNAQCFLEQEGGYAVFTQEHGGKIYFSEQTKEVIPECFDAGLTNCSAGLVGAKYDWMNARFNPQEGGGEVIAGDNTRYHFLDGTVKIYKPSGMLVTASNPLGKKRKMRLCAPNGKELGFIRWIEKSPGEASVEGSNGLKVSYKRREEKNSSHLWIDGEHLPSIQYVRSEIKHGEPFGRIQKILPEGRFLWIDHYRKGSYGMDPHKVEIGGADDPRFGKVASLKEPVGDSTEPIETYRFIYHPDQGMTEVFDAYQHLTRYYADDCKRLKAIKHYRGRGPYRLYRQERLYWGKKGRLRCRALLDNKNAPYLCIHYEYDKRGNVLTESLWGPITGKGGTLPLKISELGIPSGAENIKCHYTYSDDGFNLRLSEKNRKRHIFYKYFPGSDRLSAKLISDKRKICLRTFYGQDEQGAISYEINDNGSGEEENNLQDVTERQITRYTNSPEGFPLQKNELYLDLSSGREIVLNAYRYFYDAQGRKLGEERLDAKGKLLYRQEWEYDSRGRLRKETNALGQCKEYAYDENGNKVWERGPDPELTTRYSYDFANRLILTEKKDRDGRVYSASNTYIFTHQKASSTNFYGETSRYACDDFGRLTILKHPPLIGKEDKLLYPKEYFEYDLQGFITKQTGCEGGQTLKEYNLFGKPLYIEYPDGGIEKYTYNGSGELIQIVGKGGEVTTLQNDYLSRPLFQEIHDPAGRLLSKKEWGYRGSRLIFEKGEDGLEIHYRYDQAGRLNEKQVGERKILYFYDPFGRIVRERDYYGAGPKDFIETNRSFDLLGRLIEEKNDQVREVYTYDLAGNRSSITTYFGAKPATRTLRYDILGRVIEERASNGGKTFFFYEGRSKKSVDPLGNQVVEHYSAQGAILSLESFDAFQKPLLKQTWTRDREGRKVFQTEQGREPYTLSWEYDAGGNMIRKTEGVGTTRQKNHVYNYDISGRKVKCVKPDGVEISFAYDGLGYLSELKSSDGTVHYLYFYDRFHRLVRVEDQILGTTALSTWDRQGCLSHEKLANGLEIDFESDFHGRATHVKFSDKSSVAYRYDGGLLKSVSRINPQGEVAYQHTYEVWNRGGCPLKMALPGKGGAVSYQYNPEGLLVGLASEHFSESDFSYDLKGNLLSREVGGVQERYTYDPLARIISERRAAEKERSYAYDPLGNRLLAAGSKAAYNALNQLTEAEGVEYTYDACGRLVQQKEGESVIRYAYDALDRLVEILQGEQAIRYTYDYAHRRLVKCVNGVKTFFLYQGQNEIGEQDGDGQWLNLRILGLGKGAEIAAAIAIELEGVPFIPIHTSSGNIARLLDLEGNLVESYSYRAFGEESGSGSKNPWRYSSKRVDPETSFVFFGRRYYIPRLGRWLTPDPLEEEGGNNLYAFVGNNPLTRLDLYGLSVEGTSLLDKIGRVVGHLIKGIGDHLIPIPHLRDALSALGHRLKGGSRLNFKELCRNPHSTQGYIASPRPENETSHTYICGILNRLDDCTETAGALSKSVGGEAIHFCYNSSHGLVLDLLETVAQVIGIKTHSVEIAAQLLRERIRAVGDKGKVFLHLHSQAGIIGFRALQKLTAQEKQFLHVTTYGSTKLIPPDGLGSATNIIAKRDPIPWIADPLGTARAYWTHADHVKFIPSPRSPFAAHPMKTYLAHGLPSR